MPKEFLHIYLNWSDPTTGAFNTHRSPLENESGAVKITLGRSKDNLVELLSNAVSVHHAEIEYQDGIVYLNDLDSINGTWVDGRRQKRAVLKEGMGFQIGPFVFQFSLSREPVKTDRVSETPIPFDHFEEQENLTRAFDRSELDWLVSETLDISQDIGEQAISIEGEHLVEKLKIDDPILSLEELREIDPTLQETRYLSLGGGLGSFAWIDRLVVSGIDRRDLAVLGVAPEPFRQFQRLCDVSQIPDHERLRCDSRETLDNVWGWPGYALREFVDDLRKHHYRQALKLLWRILTAPLLSDDYMPRRADFIKSIQREANRIGWQDIWQFGVVDTIRQVSDGRYAVFYSPTGSTHEGDVKLILTNFLHIAFGFPGVRLEPDLQTYRLRTGDFRKVVNAYEEHEHIYRALRQNSGDVLLRGEGMIASRILQRLVSERQNNPDIGIVHLRRMPRVRGASYGRNQRKVQNHWELQSLFWPKATYAGDLRAIYHQANDRQRQQLSNDWGGTTTIIRQDWLEMTARGLSQGWYQARFGQIDRVIPSESNQVVTVIRGNSTVNEEARITTDFIIDATGLNIELEKHKVVGDLLNTYDLPRNEKGFPLISQAFEIKELRSEAGRVFISGVMASGGAYIPVLTFAGLLYAAQLSVQALQEAGTPGIKRLKGLRSFTQWMRWLLRMEP